MIDYLAAFLMGLRETLRRPHKYVIPLDDAEYHLSAKSYEEAVAVASGVHARLATRRRVPSGGVPA